MKQLFFIFLILILSLLYCFFNKKNILKNSIFFLIIIILSFVYAYRENFFPNLMGYDYYSYLEWYNYKSFSSFDFSFENLGFNFLICVCKLLNFDFHMFLFICGVLINSLIFIYIRKQNKYFVVYIIIYLCMFYFSTFNGMRQWMSCAFFIFSIPYLMEKDFSKYVVFIFIASLFHSSALLLIFFYPLIHLNIKYYFKIILIILLSLFILFFNDIFLNILFSFSSTLGIDYADKYSNVLYQLDNGNSTLFIITITTFILYLFLCKDEKNYFYNTTIFFIISIIFSLLKINNLIFNRLSLYTSISILLFLPKILDKFDRKGKVIVSILIILLMFIMVII